MIYDSNGRAVSLNASTKIAKNLFQHTTLIKDSVFGVLRENFNRTVHISASKIYQLCIKRGYASSAMH
jgi:hypothetical protein